MPSLRGLDILEALRRDGVATRVVLLSAHLESDTVYEAVAGGVAAYLSKAAAGDRICEAIAAVARGEVILPAEVQAGLASEIRLRSEPGRPALSPREREVLALIAEGLTAPAVGRELHLSTATVKSHLKTLYEKLGVSDRAAAVAEAMRRGLLEGRRSPRPSARRTAAWPHAGVQSASPQATDCAAQSAYSAAYGPPALISSS
jgi:two-component system, NarL family, nitrate/nitrite response regulator NarL